MAISPLKSPITQTNTRHEWYMQIVKTVVPSLKEDEEQIDGHNVEPDERAERVVALQRANRVLRRDRATNRNRP